MKLTKCKTCKIEAKSEELALGYCEPCLWASGIVVCDVCVEREAVSPPITHYNGFTQAVCAKCSDHASLVAGLLGS